MESLEIAKEAVDADLRGRTLALVRANQAKAGIENVHWLKGHIEGIPLPVGTVDVMLSNCVIKLSTDKRQVLRKTACVLSPAAA